MGRHKVKDIEDKAITKTVSIKPKQLNNIIKVYGSLTKGIQALASQAEMFINSTKAE